MQCGATFLFVATMALTVLRANTLRIGNSMHTRCTRTLPFLSMAAGNKKEVLYDMPVSNHGARVRMILKAKNLVGNNVEIRQPAELGGLTSPDFEKLNPQRKMPLLVTEGGYPIAESDTIARYLMEKYGSQPPSFRPNTLPLAVLSEQLVRLHDIYISPIQGCLYKAPGYIMSVHGTDRRAAMRDLVRQVDNAETLLRNFDATFPGARKGGYLCGQEISLADATLFPTMVFVHFMMPRFFDLRVPGPLLADWFHNISSSDEAAACVREEIEGALRGWEAAGRWTPILEEMKQTQANR